MMSDSLRQRIADDAIKIGAMEGAMGEMRDQIDARDGTIAQQDEDKDGLRGEILRCAHRALAAARRRAREKLEGVIVGGRSWRQKLEGVIVGGR
eukprot:1738985-Prymnesium_polylepis.1